MGHGGLGEVEQRDELADAHLAGVLAQNVDQLDADGSRERLGDLCHPDRFIALDIGVHDRFAAGLAGGALDLGGQFQIDSHLYTYID